MNKKIKVGILILVLILFLVFIVDTYSLIKNNHNLKKLLSNADFEGDVFLNTLIPFEWDMAYTFPPYYTKKEMAKEIGFNSIYLKETVNENMVQIIFVKDKRIVSNIVGYPDEIGFDIVFNDNIKYLDDSIFTLGKVKGVNVLILKNKKGK